jgi:hypothetical protein
VWKKVFQSNESHEQAVIAILISDKVDFQTKSARKHNRGHFILTKGIIHQRKYQCLTTMHPSTLKTP